MAISFVEKLAYINKYAKGDEKLIKAVKYGRSIDKIDDEDKKKKIKEIVNKAFDNIKKINTEKEGAKKTTKPSQAVVEAKQKIDDEIEKFKKSIGRTKWLTATRYMTNSGLRKTTIEKDAKVGALPKGKRISRKTGKPYWENRANRSDVKQPPVDYPKLAKGGSILGENSEGYKSMSELNKDFKRIIQAPKQLNEFESREDSLFGKKVKIKLPNEKEFTTTITSVYANGLIKGSGKYSKLYEDKYVTKIYDDGGEVEYDTIDQRMYNFLDEDLATLEQSIKEDDKEKIEQFFSYWTGNDGHLKSLETKSNQRMYNFLKDDLATLEQSIIKNDKEKIEQFFSYWGQHLNSIRYAEGGQIGSGKNGYVAFYKGKRIEVYADTKYQAQQLAAKHFKAKKEWEVNVVLAEVDGKPYIQSTAFAKGGAVGSYKKEEYMKPIGKVSYYFYIYNEDGERDDILYFYSFEDAKNEYDTYAQHEKEDVIYYNVQFETNFAPFSFETGVVTPNGKRIAQIREGVSVQSSK